MRTNSARRHWPEDFTFTQIADRSRCRCGRIATKATPAWLPIVPTPWGRLPD